MKTLAAFVSGAVLAILLAASGGGKETVLQQAARLANETSNAGPKSSPHVKISKEDPALPVGLSLDGIVKDSNAEKQYWIGADAVFFMIQQGWTTGEIVGVEKSDAGNPGSKFVKIRRTTDVAADREIVVDWPSWRTDLTSSGTAKKAFWSRRRSDGKLEFVMSGGSVYEPLEVRMNGETKERLGRAVWLP